MSSCPICAVTYTRMISPDAVVAEVVRRLAATGSRVGGLLQSRRGGTPARCASLFLEDIGSGRRIEIFESRGGEARGCRLTTCGLAEAAAWLGTAVAMGPDILFVNRFGRQEAEGRGLLDEIASAVLAGMPVIVPVSEALLPAWQAFAGSSEYVPAEADRLEAWCRGRLLPRARSSGFEEAPQRMEGEALVRHA